MALTVPIEAIEARAATADPRKAILTVLLFIPFMLGWLLRKAWMALVYLWSAAAAGWQEAGRPRAAEGDSA